MTSAKSTPYLVPLLLLVLTGSAPAVMAETGVPGDGSSENGGVTEATSVFFVTNRARQPSESTLDSFGGERGEPGYGRCTAAFSPIPIMNDLATRLSFYVPTESRELRAEIIPGADAFWRQLDHAASQTATGTLVLFVHGYNYGLERTCRMAAEMQRALTGEATVVAFSWPSNAQPADYLSDQADLEWSVPFLAQTMARLGGEFGTDRVQVVAHSLGSRGVLFSLELLATQVAYRPLIARLVLVAPDFDSQTFVERLPDLVPMVGEITLYASSEDTPLQVSEKLSGYPRLGQAGEYLTIEAGMETIDVSPAGRYQIFGHEYFYYHPAVASDLIELVTTGKGAGEREGLRPRQRGSQRYWEIPPPPG